MKQMKIAKVLGLILALLTLTSLLSACGVSRNAVIGQWYDVDTRTFFEFTPQNKLIITGGTSPLQELDFRFQNDSALMLPDGTVLNYKIEGATLTLNVGGQDLPLTRIR